jgi:hypothetical protein
LFNKNKPLSEKDYQQLGQQVADMYDTLKPNRRALYRVSFFRGLLGGLGGVIGATVGVALLLWLLSLFGQIPILGHFVDSVRHTIESRPKSL